MRKLEYWLPHLAIVVLAAGVYANSLGNSFHFDDQHSLVENPHLRQLENIPRFFTDPQTFSRNVGSEMFRPLLLVSYALNIAGNELVGAPVLDGLGFHLINLLVHVAVSVALFHLLKAQGLAPGVASIAALLFACHPLTAEPVNYISSRSESFAVLFMLAALLFYIRQGPNAKTLSILSLVAALLTKSVATVVPFMLLAYEWFQGERRVGLLIRRQWPHWLLVLAYLGGQWAVAGGSHGAGCYVAYPLSA